MVIAWAVIFSLGVIDALWLLKSNLEFAASNWDSLLSIAALGGFALMSSGIISLRLQDRRDAIGQALHAVAKRVVLIAVSMIVFIFLAAAVVTFCCLTASAALPLQDARLAALDARLGFDWMGFVSLANSSTLASWALGAGYQSTSQVVFATMLWLCLSNDAPRLAELFALLCMTAIGTAIGMLVLPAGGAYSFHQLPPDAFNHFGSDPGMWHHDLLMRFRSATPPAIDLDTPNINCLVTFPSGHTILGLVTTYVLRGRLYTLVPAIVINGVMIVSTIPVGGHYLVDLIASGGITALSIALLRWPNYSSYNSPRLRDTGLARA